MNNNHSVTAMTLEHYPGMTETKLTAIHDAAMTRWPLGKAIIIHRVGKLYPNDQIVLVGATSSHRQAATEATAFMMDYLKTEAPFWKSEQTADGVTEWVSTRESDMTARSRWQETQ
jgi:molybdopterin synthase catalytic subunit